MRFFSLLIAIHFLFTTNGLAQCWQQVIAGNGHVLALSKDGTLWAWGGNYFGELGVGTNTESNSPLQINKAINWKEITTRNSHNEAIKMDGTLWAWGFNSYGQLGDGTNVGRYSPRQMGSDTNWQEVASGEGHTVAIRTDGSLWAWGLNGYGQLGMGNVNFSQSAVLQIGEAHDWKHVTVGNFSNLAIKDDGSLWGWGLNENGELGLDIYSFIEKKPVQIGHDTTWKQLTLGYNFTLGIKKNGTLWGWGQNYTGQLGDGINLLHMAPIQIGTGTDWQQVAAGFQHTVAIKTDGTLWAWGDNQYGQLGKGTDPDQSVPVQIGTASDWQQITAAANSTLAIRADGSLWAWGKNDHGQLGDGTNTDKNIPAEITCPVNDTKNIQLNISPNPAQDYIGLWVKGLNTDDFAFEIWDILGRPKFVRQNLPVDHRIDIKALATGTYILIVRTRDGRITRQFVKM